jgi:uncharacterized protein
MTASVSLKKPGHHGTRRSLKASAPKAANYTLTSECHCIDIPGKPGEHLLYFPLKSLYFKVNTEAAEVVRQLRNGNYKTAGNGANGFLRTLEGAGLVNGKGDRQPMTGCRCSDAPVPVRTTLLLSHRCTLSCLYCYSEPFRSGTLMPFSYARAAVETIIANAKRATLRSIDLGFHGGGEPTVNWDVLTGIVDHAKRRCTEEKLGLSVSLCTNAMLSSERAEWVSRNISNITVSIDGPPDIQNVQRPTVGSKPSYDTVAAAIDCFDRNKKPYGFRITVTKLSQRRIPEIFDHLTKRFKARNICFEPLFVCGRHPTDRCERPDAKAFSEGIKEITEQATAARIGIQYSGGRLSYIGNAFCGAAGDNFFITPDGDVTSCLEVSSRSDKRSGLFMYGTINRNSDGFDFDVEGFKKLRQLRVDKFGSCAACYARWHCAGDCLAKKPDLNDIANKANDYRCSINRELTLHQLLKQVGV